MPRLATCLSLGLLALAPSIAGAGAYTFAAPGEITIPGSGDSGPAAPYPSTILVGGVQGQVVGVTATLHGFSHSYPGDVDILLVGPLGQAVLLIADAGGTADAVRLTLTFDDAGPLPTTDPLASGVYHPGDAIPYDVDSFPLSPVPDGPWDSQLAVFHGQDPTGTWSLYVMDDGAQDVGGISDGWSLSLITREELPGTWTPVRPMDEGRSLHSSLVLPNGKLLVFGGVGSGDLGYQQGLRTALLFDPGSGAWTATAQSEYGCYGQTATLLPSGKVLAAGGACWVPGIGLTYPGRAELYDPRTGSWTLTGTMPSGRSGHTATLLRDGTVLVTGGGYYGAELYLPGAGIWTVTGWPATPRTGQTATRLLDGRVLVAGGRFGGAVQTSAEIYDPGLGTWQATGSLSVGRERHQATLLEDGRVLVVGGVDSSDADLASAEIFEPGLGTWVPAPPLGTARRGHTATLLPDGRVLVASGRDQVSMRPSVELYSPVTGTWTFGGGLRAGRERHSATLLPDGRVLVVGGYSASTALASAEIYEASRAAWVPEASPPTSRRKHTATLLNDGRVLVTGGEEWANADVPLATADLYDPTTRIWTATAPMLTARRSHAATLLHDGRVLVTGGCDGNTWCWSGSLASAEIWDPATQTWTAAAPMATPRDRHTATILPNGQVLVAGGAHDGAVVPSVEIYTPLSGAWAATDGLERGGRYQHTATALPNGKVLVFGGESGFGVDAFAELYDPITATWAAAGHLVAARIGHTATLLPGGAVLAAGGVSDPTQAGVSELYDPETGVWRLTGSLGTERYLHTASLLANGKVLVAGGSDHANTLASCELYDPATGSWTAAPDVPVAQIEHETAPLLDDDLLLVGQGTYHYHIDMPASGRRPQITSTTTPLTHGVPLLIEGTGLDGDNEAAGGVALTAAANYPLVRFRSLGNGHWAWLPPDALESFWGVPVLSVSSLPATIDPGWGLLSVHVAGLASGPKVVAVECGLSLTPPEDVTVALGETATFRAVTQGGRRFQWQREMPEGWMELPGMNAATFTTPPVTGADSGARFRYLALGACQAATSEAATLTVADTNPPTASVVSPSGGEYWLLSETGPDETPGTPDDPPAATQIVSWEMDDDIRVCQVVVSLLYSTDGGAQYQAAEAGGGLPATFGTGGSCPSPGVLVSNLTYTVPTSFPNPSHASGALYKIQVAVTDQVGQTTLATSANPFYVVNPNPDSVRTLILVNLPRMQAVMGVSSADAAALGNKLRELAEHPRVQGLVVNLAGVTDLCGATGCASGTTEGLYHEWDQDPSDPDKANAVLFGCATCSPARTGVHGVVTRLLEAYTGTKYLLVVGDDRIVPFARLADQTTLLPESTYTEGTDLTPAGTTVGQALAADRLLTDDALGVVDDVTTADLAGALFIPDLAVGRLVETPAEITTAIATFISQDGVLDLSALGADDHQVLVTGYDFLLDVAKQIRMRFKKALGQCDTSSPPVCSPDADEAPVDGHLVGATWGLSDAAQRADALLDALCGHEGDPFAIASVSGHATHHEEGVPGESAYTIEGLATEDMAASDACGASQALSLAGSVAYAVGCHGGLPVPGSDPADADHSLDLVQTLLGRGAVAYVANTGYGWGLKSGIGYSERLVQLLTEELTKTGTIAVGEAVTRAKQSYYLETPRFDAYDEKALMEWTLFGLPMYGVKTGIASGRPAGDTAFEGPAPGADERAGVETYGPVVVARQLSGSVPGRGEAFGSAAAIGPTLPAVSLPPYLTRLDLHFDFTATGVYSLFDSDGDDVTASGCTDPGGCYYTLNGLVSRSTGAGDLPLQPYFVYDSRLSGTSQHGLLWKGGTYDEEDGFTFVVGELQSNASYTVDHGAAPRTTKMRSIAPRLVPGQDPDECRTSDLEVNSLVVDAGEAVKPDETDSTWTIERKYREIDLEVYYFNNTSDSNENCDRTGPSLAAGPYSGKYHQASAGTITWAVPASDTAGVWRVIAVVTDNTVDGQGQGVWTPVELADDGTGTWRGSRTIGSSRATYVLQAVDRRGNVTWLEYEATGARALEASPLGADGLPSSGVPLGVAETVDVPLVPALAPTIFGFSPPEGSPGMVVTVMGSNFQGASSVTFGGVPAGDFSVSSPTRLVASVPLGAVSGPISVTTPTGQATSAQSFSVVPPPPPPAASVADSRTREGNTGRRSALFRVWLSRPVPVAVTVSYATANGTAIGCLDSLACDPLDDYVATSGTLTFAPFARSRTVPVPVIGDRRHEPAETFTLTLTGAVGADLGRREGKGTILDDDR